MDALQAIILGIVQGLTEFLPISSSGHLRIVPALLGWDDPGTAFTAVIQIGTMLAILVYFRSDIARIFMAWLRGLTNKEVRKTLDSRMGWYIALGTFPISIAGIALKDQIEDGARSLTLIGSTLIVFGLILFAAEKISKQKRDVETIGVRDAFFIGCAQALALVPGVSRSGATITAGLFCGFNREAAARYSFLLSIPAVLLSGLYELKDVIEGTAHGSAGAVPTVIATVVSFVVGYASIAFLLRYLAKHSTNIFVGYRLIVGIAVLALVATGSIS